MSGPFVCLLTSHHLWMYIFYSTKTNLTRLISPDLELFGSSCVFSYLTFITCSVLSGLLADMVVKFTLLLSHCYVLVYYLISTIKTYHHH